MKIKITKNGPYAVDKDIHLEREEAQSEGEDGCCCWEKTGKVETSGLPANASRKALQAGEYHLCRCGQSKNEPFCDGSHVKAEFKCDDAGTEEKFEDGMQKFKGKKYILCDKPKLCASARFCHRAGSAWVLVRKHNEQSEKILKEEVHDCPSGRLVLKDKKTGEIIEEKYEPTISLTEDKPAGVSGPVWVKGGIEIESPDGKKYEKRNRVTLCRCGKSSNKPFCDGSHITERFKEKN